MAIVTSAEYLELDIKETGYISLFNRDLSDPKKSASTSRLAASLLELVLNRLKFALAFLMLNKIVVMTEVH